MDNSILPMRSLCSFSESTNLAMDLLVESSEKAIPVTYSSISPDSGSMSFTEKLSFTPITHSHLEGKNAVSRTRWISGFEYIVRPLLTQVSPRVDNPEPVCCRSSLRSAQHSFSSQIFTSFSQPASYSNCRHYQAFARSPHRGLFFACDFSSRVRSSTAYPDIGHACCRASRMQIR